jgi:hypothetical protein
MKNSTQTKKVITGYYGTGTGKVKVLYQKIRVLARKKK